MEIVLQEFLQDKIFLTAAGEFALSTESEEGDLLDMDSLELKRCPRESWLESLVESPAFKVASGCLAV